LSVFIFFSFMVAGLSLFELSMIEKKPQ